jgi:glycosyltransferase involved in cell wall biosynthesis
VQGYEPEYYWLERQPIKWLMSLLSYRFALEQVANAPIYCGHRNIRARSFVPPGLDLNLFRPSGRYRDFADGQPIVLGCIGRREPGKGTRYVLDAFERLNATDSRFRLRVAFGNLPEGWKHPACEIVVPDGDAELAEFYRSLDIMVAPGTVQHGAAHYPVLEAMACGIPIITTGYIPADEANSWIVANKNSTAIVDATHTIVSDPYYGERVARALEDIRSFAWPVVAARMLASFQEEAGA